MADRRASPGIWAILTLGDSRALVRRPRFFLLATVIAVVYALIAMVVGGMLTVFWPPAHLSSFWVILSSGTPWWDYPGLLAVNPFFVLSLPFLPTLFMLLTSAGVGLGMSVAVILSIGLLRQRKSSSARPATVGTVAGLTPAMIALVTLGACCSTTAAATAGIGITAQATGTSTGTLLLNNWYLGVFQLVILYVALLAQEQLLRVYGSLVPSSSAVGSRTAEQPPLDRRFAAGATLRVLLLAAGVTWCLVMLADWLTVNPATASAGTWVGWILQHQLIGFAAIFAALVPVPMYRAFLRLLPTGPGLILRGVLVVVGLSLAVGTPPPLAASGWHGFVNELMGAAGIAASLGAIAPGVPLGLALAVRWAVQYVLLGGFAVALGLRPMLALRPILWTVTGARETLVPTAPSTPGTDSPVVPESRLTLAPETGR
ncbi:MAG: hypothetical protein WCB18_07920 [Thermoplasmata archaeon]